MPFDREPVTNPCYPEYKEYYPNVEEPWFSIWKEMKESSLSESPENIVFDQILFDKDDPDYFHVRENNVMAIRFNEHIQCSSMEHFPYIPEGYSEAEYRKLELK